MTRRDPRRDSQPSSTRTSARLFDRVDAALRARRTLLASTGTNAIRLFNGQPDGIDGLMIDKYADVLVVQCHQGRLSLRESEARAVCEHVMRKLGAIAVYKKIFTRDRNRPTARSDDSHRDAQPWIGKPVEPRIAILETGMQLWIRPYDGLATGLYLDQRDNRRLVREWANGRRVLNTFSYTCAFSVAAALGSAAETVSVDVSKKHLEWGKQNFAANHVALEGHQFVCADAQDYLKRARRQNRRFDLIILDPPSFARAKRPAKVFNLRESLPSLVAEASERLDRGGRLLVSTNHRGISIDQLTRTVEHAMRKHTVTVTTRETLPTDFAGDADYVKTVVARLN